MAKNNQEEGKKNQGKKYIQDLKEFVQKFRKVGSDILQEGGSMTFIEKLGGQKELNKNFQGLDLLCIKQLLETFTVKEWQTYVSDPILENGQINNSSDYDHEEVSEKKEKPFIFDEVYTSNTNGNHSTAPQKSKADIMLANYIEHGSINEGYKTFMINLNSSDRATLAEWMLDHCKMEIERNFMSEVMNIFGEYPVLDEYS